MCLNISVNPKIETEVIIQNDNNNKLVMNIEIMGTSIIALLATIGKLTLL